MTVIEKLESWKKRSNGIVDTQSIISLKTDGLNITVSGANLEEAYSKLEQIVSIPDDTKNETLNAQTIPASAPTTTTGGDKLSLPFQNIKPATPIPQTLPQTPLDSSKQNLQQILNGRQILRIYKAGEILSPLESTATIGNITYVCK